MSSNDDYDDWEPVIDVVEENKLTEIEIRAVTREDLSTIEKTAIDAIAQKLEKLNIILKNLDVYCVDNALLVNDRYGICNDLYDITQAFGFEVKQVECSLRGKSYIIQDTLVELIHTINPQFSIERFVKCLNTPEIVAVIKKYARPYAVNERLFHIFQTIQSMGHYTVIGTQRVVTTYEDGRMIDQNVGEVVSDEAATTSFLRDYMEQTSATLKKTNENLRDGTVRLLYSRARQMGYAVKEERNGTQVQLVLVRNG